MADQTLPFEPAALDRAELQHAVDILAKHLERVPQDKKSIVAEMLAMQATSPFSKMLAKYLIDALLHLGKPQPSAPAKTVLRLVKSSEAT
jgi:hypothetical protein